MNLTFDNKEVYIKEMVFPWDLKRQIGCSLEGLMLKLKLQYFAISCKELTHWKIP